MKGPEKIIIAVTGATGAPLADHLIRQLAHRIPEIHIIFSYMGEKVFRQEVRVPKNLSLDDYFSEFHSIRIWDPGNFSAPFASGSGVAHAMVIIPCSMKTLSAVANGYSYSLIERAADVMLKERRTLVLVPRETPLNSIHLQNMLQAGKAGAIILPPVPAFYTFPESLEDIKAYISGKIMENLKISHELYPRWSDHNENEPNRP
ncbi:MAG: 3-octaprenyl-4-hydroxybenzoate carboxy-lyase [Marinimicrobia bacterium 46_47]|nr:MAG: 3-octaprenyl-4-hydroxybenzoate carboxy-lyase [Marinimicrobia bacterium 46_47]KUK91820.1 MAG: 3-octaprenyl-4-hydroxybenzoate carboxy-lyase [Marinimicrobia bacterium 46_43]